MTAWGTYGVPSTVVTPTMEEKGYSFATTGHNEGELYNGYTDKTFGIDDISRKEWGFSGYTAAGWDWWRHTPTGSTVDGYDTARFTQDNEGILTYTFEVDDDSLLKINFGTRKIGGWADVTYNLTINGAARGLVSATETETAYSYYAKGIYDEETGKYYVTINFGNGLQYAYVNWIEIITADNEDGYDTQPYMFVLKGETPRLYDWENNYIFTEISAEDQAVINGAAYFTQVTIDCTALGKTYTDVSVTVVPGNLVYFIDVGGYGDGRMMLADTIYVPGENTCGLTGAEGEAGWQAFDYTMSCRYNGTEKEIKYFFDVEDSVYGVIAGTIGHWGPRNSKMQVNDDEAVAFDAEEGISTVTTVATTVSGGEGMTVCFLAGDDSTYETAPLVNFIAVYEKETVAFDSNGGQPVETILFDAGETVSLTEIVPVRENYAFDGWYDSEELKVDFVTDSATLTAHWTEIKYTVTFNSNGGSEVSSVEVVSGSSVQQPQDPVKDGYIFAGWYDEQLENEFDFETLITEDLTLYAKWEQDSTGGETDGSDEGTDEGTDEGADEGAGGCSSAMSGGAALLSFLTVLGAAGVVVFKKEKSAKRG